MTSIVRIAAAAALIAFAQGCSDDEDRGPPPSTCSPTVQTNPDPAGAEQYCTDFNTVWCNRSFGDCPGLGAGDIFATAEECRAAVVAYCSTEDFSNDWYDAPCGRVCVGFLAGADCSVLLTVDEPQACSAATGTFGPPPPPPPPPSIVPEPVSTITVGTIQDTISNADPLWQGGYARAYAIHFTAGQTVLIETSPPTSGTPIYDSVVHLLDPGLVQIGSNDDGSSTPLYSRLQVTTTTTGYHRIVVRGYSTIRVGSYQLTVTIL